MRPSKIAVNDEHGVALKKREMTHLGGENSWFVKPDRYRERPPWGF